MTRSKLNKLPKTTLNQLHQRLVEQDHLTVNDHLIWIQEQGHSVSRSALHRYLMAYRKTMLENAFERGAAIQSEEALRRQCLDIASRTYKGEDKAALLGLAQDLVDWIHTAKLDRITVA